MFWQYKHSGMNTRTLLTAGLLMLGSCGVMSQSPKPGTLLVLNKNDNTLSFVDADALKVVKTIPVGEGSHELAVSADGKLAYAPNYATKTHGHSLSVIDVVAQKEIRRVELSPLLRPHGVEERDGKVYFISELTRTVARYDYASDTLNWITGTGQDGGHMVVLTPDGKWIYTANRSSNTVSAIEIGETGSPGKIFQIATGSRPEGIDISPDGKELWVGNTGDGSIDIIDVSSNRIKQRLTVGKVPIRIKFTPDGKRVLVSDNGAAELLVIDAQKREVIKRLKAEGSPVGLLVTPDGKRAFIARSGANLISVVDLGTLDFVGDIRTGNNPDGMAWVK